MWVAVDGPFNEHLVRDVGALNLALAFVAAMALATGSVASGPGGRRRRAHLRGAPPRLPRLQPGAFDTGDSVAMLGGLAFTVVAAIVALGGRDAPAEVRGGTLEG